jgi:hypothetical protein
MVRCFSPRLLKVKMKKTVNRIYFHGCVLISIAKALQSVLGNYLKPLFVLHQYGSLWSYWNRLWWVVDNGYISVSKCLTHRIDWLVLVLSLSSSLSQEGMPSNSMDEMGDLKEERIRSLTMKESTKRQSTLGGWMRETKREKHSHCVIKE